MAAPELTEDSPWRIAGATIGALLRPPAVLEPAAAPCGEAFVRQPELAGSAVHRYTTYLVTGVLGGTPFSGRRRRYSDFEWLRKALVACLPGVFVPPLPKKQVAGRFDEAFVEARRLGLEEFLQRCLRIRPLALGCPLFRSFLEASGPALEELRKSAERRPATDLCREYKAAFEDELRSLAPAPDDWRFLECRAYLERQLPLLRNSMQSLREAADAQRQATALAVAAEGRMTEVCGPETDALAPLVPPDQQPRALLLARWRRHNEVLGEAPALHQEILMTAAERELDDTEAMQEALASLEALQQRLQDAKRRADALESSYSRVQAGGEPTGRGISKLFGAKKDRASQLAELQTDLEAASREAVLFEEWYIAARTVLVGHEVDGYLASKVAVHRWSQEQFAYLTGETARKLASVWQGAANA